MCYNKPVYPTIQNTNDKILNKIMRGILIHFLDRIKDYEHESGHSMHEDKRESSEIVDLHLNNSPLDDKDALVVKFCVNAEHFEIASKTDYPGTCFICKNSFL
jgi:hypothetical protein